MRRIIRVQVLEGYRLDLTFDDGVSGVVDLSEMAGKGVFVVWNDRQAFESVRVGPSGELAWDGQVDLCPDALYLKVTHQQPEELLGAKEQSAV